MEAPTYTLLKKRILTRYKTLRSFSHAAGLSDSALSHIFAGRNMLTQQNMINFARLLDIPHEQFYDYFFT